MSVGNVQNLDDTQSRRKKDQTARMVDPSETIHFNGNGRPAEIIDALETETEPVSTVTGDEASTTNSLRASKMLRARDTQETPLRVVANDGKIVDQTIPVNPIKLSRQKQPPASQPSTMPMRPSDVRESQTVRESILRYTGMTAAVIAYLHDIIGTVVALILAFEISYVNPFNNPSVPALPILVLAIGIWAVVFFFLPIYDPQETRKPAHELRNVLIGVGTSSLALAGILYLISVSMPRSFVLAFFLLDFFFLLGARLVVGLTYRVTNQPRYPVRRALIIGTDMLADQTAEVIKKYEWSGLQVSGFVGDITKDKVNDFPVLGSIAQVRQVVEAYDIAEVYIALAYEESHLISNIMYDLRLTPVYIHAVPDSFTLSLYRATSVRAPEDKVIDFERAQVREDATEIYFINLRAPILTMRQYLLKRLVDILISSMVILAASPLMILTAILIKLDSPGPVIFKQKRVGENGSIFYMYKFRSMVKDAEARIKDVVQYDDKGNTIHKVSNDARVTRVGKWIRRLSVDELPQFFNILKGDMSVVGPRPELPMLVKEYSTWQFARFAVPQGLTGWWQVNGRSSKLMHLHTEYDLYYVQNYSLSLDIRILFKTLPAVLARTGAF